MRACAGRSPVPRCAALSRVRGALRFLQPTGRWITVSSIVGIGIVPRAVPPLLFGTFANSSSSAVTSDFGRHGARQEALGAQLEREALVLRIVVAARVEQEGNGLQALVLLPLAAQRKAVHARQHDVGNDRMGRLAPRGVQRSQPVARSDDPVTPARKQLVERAQLGLALERNQDHTHASVSLRARALRCRRDEIYACFLTGQDRPRSMPMRGLFRTLETSSRPAKETQVTDVTGSIRSPAPFARAVRHPAWARIRPGGCPACAPGAKSRESRTSLRDAKR